MKKKKTVKKQKMRVKKQKRYVKNKKTIKKFARLRRKTKGGDEGSVLGQVFGEIPKVRLINFFFRNELTAFSVKELIERTRLMPVVIRHEGDILVRSGMLIGHGSGPRRSYKLNLSFPFSSEFKNLVQHSSPIDKNKLISIVKKSGKLRLILVSGLFLNREDSSVDLFVVGDGLSEKRLEAAVKELEAIIGKDLRWAGMETQEFLYRWRMFDRFLYDMLAMQHEKIFVSKPSIV